MFKGYKTLVVNGAVVLLMVMRIFWPEAELPEGEDVGAAFDKADAGIVAAMGIVNMLLRAVTSTSIFSRG